MYVLEAARFHRIASKYREPGDEKLELEDFTWKISLEDLVLLRNCSVNGWFALGLMTIGSMMR